MDSEHKVVEMVRFYLAHRKIVSICLPLYAYNGCPLSHSLHAPFVIRFILSHSNHFHSAFRWTNTHTHIQTQPKERKTHTRRFRLCVKHTHVHISLVIAVYDNPNTNFLPFLIFGLSVYTTKASPCNIQCHPVSYIFLLFFSFCSALHMNERNGMKRNVRRTKNSDNIVNNSTTTTTMLVNARKCLKLVCCATTNRETGESIESVESETLMRYKQKYTNTGGEWISRLVNDVWCVNDVWSS